jgi:tetratricopeptide (TPR) repeat protein
MYWLCHADASGLVLGSKKISPDELFEICHRQFHRQSRGLVFLNACQTAEQGREGSFMEALHDAGLSGMVATEERTVNIFANHFGLDFLKAFLQDGESIGKALQRLRGRGDPLGLLYGTYCPPDIRVFRPAKALAAPVAVAGGTGPVAASATFLTTKSGRFPLPPNPYPSLAYYDREQRPLFAGRDDDVARFAELLNVADTRILVLHGESGVGKSSFLLAGVIPFLEEECIGYRILTRKPANTTQQCVESERAVLFVRATNDLCGQLAQRLFDYCGEPISFETPTQGKVVVDLPGLLAECLAARTHDVAALQMTLQQNPMLLGRLLATLGAQLPYSPVLVIDQCVEVFTLARAPRDHENRRLALEMLRQVIGVPGRYKVIVSLRTEYYGRLIDRLRYGRQAVAGVREYLLTDFTEAQLVDAIRRPTLTEPIPYADKIPYDKYGFRYGEGVAEALARQALDFCARKQDSVLPLVQVICAQLYEVARGRPDKMIDRQDLGEFEGGMRRHVDQLVCRLLPQRSDRSAFKRLFIQLYLTQPDGALTTALLGEEELAHRWKGRTPFHQMLASATKGDFRLLRVNTLRIGGLDERRYVSLGHDALAPVAARWDEDLRRWARVRKWVALCVVLVSIATVMLLLTAYAWESAKLARSEANRANNSLNEALKAAEELRVVAEDLLEDVSLTEPWQRDLLKQTLAIYENLAVDNGTDPSQRQMLAKAHSSMGKIEQMLGDVDAGEKHLNQAILILKGLEASFPGRADYRHDLAVSHNDLADLLREQPGSERKEMAQDNYGKAIELERVLLEADPIKPEYRKEVARAHDGLGLLLPYGPFNDPTSAGKKFDLAIKVLREVADAEPANQFEIARVYMNRGILLKQHTDKDNLALEDYTRATNILKKLRDEGKESGNYRRYKVRLYRHYLSKLYTNRGLLYDKLLRFQEAVGENKQAVLAFEELVRYYPLFPDYRAELALSQDNLGNRLRKLGRFQEAEEALRESRSHYRRLIEESVGRPKSRPNYQSGLGSALHDLWLVIRDRDDSGVISLFSLPARAECPSCFIAASTFQAWRLHNLTNEALDLLKEASRNQQAALGADRQNNTYRERLCGHFWGLSEIYLRLGAHEKAAEEARNLHGNLGSNVRRIFKLQPAKFLARCIQLVENAPGIPPAQRNQVALSYAKEAVSILTETMRRLNLKWDKWDEDSEFEPVRRYNREGFEKLRPK